MTSRKSPVVQARKRPSQERSTQLVAAILEAAIRVLTREGAARFTTSRVAEAAGVSVGSLYQYFPNKEAILFKLQADEWAETGVELKRMLADPSRAPLDRLKNTARVFLQSEYEEAAFRTALNDAAPLYRDSPEAKRQRQTARRLMLDFVAEVLPAMDPKQRPLTADMLMLTMSALGEQVSTMARSKAEIDKWGVALGEMLSAYVVQLDTQLKAG